MSSLRNLNIRLHLAYDGSLFSGFQSQRNGRTVQDEIQKALKKITQKEIIITTAGRTDKGVHARHQVVSFGLCSKFTLSKLIKAMNSVLPSDISVLGADNFPGVFNAKTQSIGKQYIYQIYQSYSRDPFLDKQSLLVRSKIDIDSMKKGAIFLLGHNDYESFRAKSCTSKHAVRYIWDLNIYKKDKLIILDIKGNAFCQNMVRIITGTLLEVGLGKRDFKDIKRILDAKDRRQAGVTIKPHGLFLNRVYYPDNLVDAGIPQDASFPRYPVSDITWPYKNEDIEMSLGI